jgi:tellurite resistance protein TerC
VARPVHENFYQIPARPFGTTGKKHCADPLAVRVAFTKGFIVQEALFQTVAPTWLWVAFVAIVLAALFIDFVVLNKQGAHEVSVKEAINWSIIWVVMSFLFNALFWWAVKDSTGSTAQANEKSLEFLTGYLIEKSLAVDNIFVFLMIFTYFAVPAAYQKRVLMIGIIGAIVLRTIMILIGGWLLAQFHWILYVFGAFLVLTGLKMWWAAGKEQSLDDNPALKLLRKILPVSKNYDGEKFWTVENGKKIATPLFMVICLVGLTDVIFAVDSIPAIFAITDDPFIVLTSNVFAILGLRAMYFLLAAVANKFHLLTYGLAVILVFIGTKMMLIDIYKIPVFVSLLAVVSILAITMIWSLKTAPKSNDSAT